MHIFNIILLLTPPISAAVAPVVSTQTLSLREIVASFNKSTMGLYGMPFPPILVRVMYYKLLRTTYDPNTGTILLPSDGMFTVEISETTDGGVNVKLAKGDTRVPVQQTCGQLEVLANERGIDNYFYRDLLEACDRNQALVSPMPNGRRIVHPRLGGAIPPDVYVEMIWNQVIRVYRLLDSGSEWLFKEFEPFFFIGVCMDEYYDLMVRLMDPPVRLEGGDILGRGSFGLVQRGEWRHVGKVAVKTINLRGFIYDKVVNEVLANRAMYGDPHFVNVYRVELKDYHTIAFSMELLEGKDGLYLASKELLKDMRILAAIIKEVLKGIQSLHKKNFLHNDIKPDNIFITKEGKVKVLDLGLATPIGRPFHSGQWKAGVAGIAGPELYDPLVDYTTASDVWTVGVLMVLLYANTSIQNLPIPLRDNPNQPPMNQATLKAKYGFEIRRFLRLFSHPVAKNFLESILQYESSKRPKIHELLEHEFIKTAASEEELKELIAKA